ncbi:hypothetical protein BT63DRAFT_414008 [Microthyrium microscopicum]|uniref:Uncharacterized protein n=1 Tax=Microthyrium microscopicum TaxID=703497 RepID=A0A6A6UFE3_9PEZI|nr:hypothetical protein BT63DRAFT_414008 [Microthyrium microscopicum]
MNTTDKRQNKDQPESSMNENQIRMAWNLAVGQVDDFCNYAGLPYDSYTHNLPRPYTPTTKQLQQIQARAKRLKEAMYDNSNGNLLRDITIFRWTDPNGFPGRTAYDHVGFPLCCAYDLPRWFQCSAEWPEWSYMIAWPDLPLDVVRLEEPKKEIEIWPRGCPLCQDRFCDLRCPYLKADNGKKDKKFMAAPAISLALALGHRKRNVAATGMFFNSFQPFTHSTYLHIAILHNDPLFEIRTITFLPSHAGGLCELSELMPAAEEIKEVEKKEGKPWPRDCPLCQTVIATCCARS